MPQQLAVSRQQGWVASGDLGLRYRPGIPKVWKVRMQDGLVPPCRGVLMLCVSVL